MKSVETFVQRSDGPDHLSRRHLIKAFAATLIATQFVGMGVGGPEAATAVVDKTQSRPAYDGIVGLL